MRSLCFAEPVRARSCQAGRGNDDNGPVAVEHGELTPVRNGRLMNVAREDELCTCLGEQGEHRSAPCERLLARAPGSVCELVVEADTPQRAGRGVSQPRCHAVQSLGAHATGLVAPGSHRAHADHVKTIRVVDGFGCPPLALELSERMREPGRRQQRDVVIAGNGEHRWAEAAQEGRRALVLGRSASMREVARGHDEVRPNGLDEGAERRLDTRPLACARVEVGDVDEARWHSRGRLYTGSVADEPTELFDDLYLGLRAGGAMRKQRRGEPLTMEEEAALNRWQRLSSWRKTIAVGAFALGTFGLGFTIGGLVFGRGRKAKA